MRCREDLWLCMCDSVCVVFFIIICPRCSPFCNNNNNNNNNNLSETSALVERGNIYSEDAGRRCKGYRGSQRTHLSRFIHNNNNGPNRPSPALYPLVNNMHGRLNAAARHFKSIPWTEGLRLPPSPPMKWHHVQCRLHFLLQSFVVKIFSLCITMTGALLSSFFIAL